MSPEPTTRCDLAVIGGGIAGLYAALCVGDEAEVLLLSKGPLRSSASFLAQGGVAAATALLDRGWGKPAQAPTGADGEREIQVTSMPDKHVTIDATPVEIDGKPVAVKADKSR